MRITSQDMVDHDYWVLLNGEPVGTVKVADTELGYIERLEFPVKEGGEELDLTKGQLVRREGEVYILKLLSMGPLNRHLSPDVVG